MRATSICTWPFAILPLLLGSGLPSQTLNVRCEEQPSCHSCDISTQTHTNINRVPAFHISSMAHVNGSIGQLPVELQLEVFKHLDCPSSILLARTNHHFQELVKPPEFQVMQLGREVCLPVLHCLERDPENWDRFACSQCFRLRPSSEFEKKQTSKKRRKAGNEAAKRFCMNCGLRWSYGYRYIASPQGKFTPSSQRWLCSCRSSVQQGMLCQFCSCCAYCRRIGGCLPGCIDYKRGNFLEPPPLYTRLQWERTDRPTTQQ